ncbi:Decaprenyl-diphosphate synthase subunit 1 [Folsomia candida]|uniref:Decaprenyl-diphosphate synthase subunit 1 n=1 Tax=Folsomia candida TaxID=158441 RepID=A0A226DUD5_FOLCA|nr:Decaprenyl-diphosphate synthase subunit 1 [Folsomia candida]
MYKIFPIDHFSNSGFPSCVSFKATTEIPLRKNVGQQRGWKCLTRFYILPPTNRLAGVLPPDPYEERFSSNEGLMIPYYRIGYHVLLQGTGSNFNLWANEMLALLNENSGLNMLLMLVDNSIISNFQFCCRYCHGCFQVCYDIDVQKFEEVQLENVAKGFNIMGDKTPWATRGDWKYLKYGTTKFSEIGRDDVNIDGILVNLILAGNVSAQFGTGTSIFVGIFLISTSKSKLSKLDILAMGYNIFLEQGSSITRNSKKEKHIYFVCGSFLLMTVIITTLSRGDNVQNTISPIRILPYGNFDQLIENGFTFVDEVISYLTQKALQGQAAGWYPANYLALSNIDTSSTAISSKVYHHLVKGNVHLDHSHVRPETNIWWNYPRQIITNSSGFSCASEKMAYLGSMEKLQEAKAYLEKYRPGPEFSIGKELVGVIPTGWVLENVVDPRIPVRMKALHHSGIAKKWMWFQEMAGKLQNRSNVKEIEPAALSLDGNIAQIFKIFSQILLSTACLFMIECGNICSTYYNGKKESEGLPVWTTRYNIVDFCIFMTPFTKRPPIKYKIFLIDHFNNSKFPSCVAFEANREIPLRSNAGQQRAWKCLTRFYIFPPTKQFAGVLPPDLYEEHFSSRRKMIPYYRTGYHVLVQDAESYFRIWINEMQILLNENSGLNMLLMLVNDNVVSNFQFCCRYCHGCFQVCHDIGNEKLDELEIAKVAYGFNTMGDKTLWVIRGNWNYLKNGSIKFSEIGKDTVKIDSTLINLFLGGNVSAKLGRDILTMGYNIFLEQGSSITRNSQGEKYIYFVCGPFLLISETNIWWKYPRQIITNSSGFSCASEKMAYLGSIEKLQEAKAYLEKYRSGPEFSIGKELVGVIPTGWVLENVVNPRNQVRMKALHHSGIAKKWVWFQEMAGKLQNRVPVKGTDPIALSLDGNIAQIFKIFSKILLSIACLFMIEVVYWKLSNECYLL